MPTPPRPKMWQTYVPFVEMYINGRDLLRSSSGKPRSLMSFSHDVVKGSGGMWTIELFDPAYIAVEEMMLSTGVSSTDVADEQFGGAGDGGGATKDRSQILQGAMFRYGYMGAGGDVVLSKSPQGEEYYYGRVHTYVPTYQPHGTLLTIRGDSTGSGIVKRPKTYTSFYGMNTYDIVKTMCKRYNWELVPLGGGENNTIEEIPPEKRPVTVFTPSAAIDNTEEQAETHRMKEDEDPLDFITRICNSARPVGQEFNTYAARLEYRAQGSIGDGTEGVPVEPTGYLFYGPQDVVKNQPVRTYVYLRDPTSDVLSFAPTIQAWTTGMAGVAGLLWKVDDRRLGVQDGHSLDEAGNRTMKYDREKRVPITVSAAQLQAYQEGEPEHPDAEDKPEGGNTGPQVMAPAQADQVNEVRSEQTVPIADRKSADMQVMDYWMKMHNFVNSANLEIFGDPSPDVQPGNNVVVLLYVPTEENQLRIHWVSTLWHITGVTHNIQGGSFTSSLDLTRAGMQAGGVTSRAVYNAILEGNTPEGMRRLGGS